ncbi:MtrAB system histidine kinase MtrB [Bifidobacterium sp. ESL0820]|uniref:MtrAB system histidine kinase MtrB n=1 Tax=Bifidobacterium sp. ESL0820 TaxID=3448586 RepID=UPI0040426B66
MSSRTRHRVVSSAVGMFLRRLYRAVRSSLQIRMVLLATVSALLIGVVFMTASLYSVRTSLLNQVLRQAQADFAAELTRAQGGLDSADITGDEGSYQKLVVNMAANVQNEGAPNMVGVFIWPDDSTARRFVPVSTAPGDSDLITPEIRNAVVSNGGHSYSQMINTADKGQYPVPGIVMGSMLRPATTGGIEFYAIYSFADQQRSVLSVQMALLAVSVVTSVVMGIIVFLALHSVIRPVTKVAGAAKGLAQGESDVRVTEDRTDELGTLQRSFNVMADSINEKIGQLEEAEAYQRRFVSDVSHELRTPVTTIRMATDLLFKTRDDLDPSKRRTVELLDKQVSRFASMLEDLLEISRYEAGQTSLNPDLCDACDLVRNVVQQVAQIARTKGVPVKALLPDHKVMITVDASRCTSILRNLVNNAIDFAEDGPVQLRLAVSEQAVVFSVRDWGTGIAPEDLTHIFERFWRADPSRSRLTGGTGLGLSIALDNTNLMHGLLQVRSQVGQGTWFLLTLPRDVCEQLDQGSAPVRFQSGHGLDVEGFFEEAAS